MAMTLSELAARIGARLEPAAAADRTVTGCATLAEATDRHVSFLTNPRYAPQLAATQAAAVIVGPDTDAPRLTRLVADDPYFAFGQAMFTLHGQPPPGEPAIHPAAHIHPTATLGDGCRVGPGCEIGAHATLGEHCTLHANVVIYPDCVLGDRVTLHAGCVIGVDGFGYATHDGEHHKIPPAGRAVIQRNVEMGANCIVERATLGDTVVGAGTKFADAVVIGHGSKVGRHNLFVAQVGLAGSVVTGDYVAIGGQSGVAGHLRIGDRAQIAAHSGVMSDVPADTKVGGTPATELSHAKRLILLGRRLPEMLARIKRLERRGRD